ncbi:MAG: hypothetical protein ACK53Y_26645 [bacterium]
MVYRAIKTKIKTNIKQQITEVSATTTKKISNNGKQQDTQPTTP